ncbi:MAG TPA: PhzF family phenazine biosynthesis isomerase [Steroidobacteraceae bacterium]|nr:PhzF family phenazine biosynthesis isomerase [Steroidobacteraceae bacterium]
MEWLERFFVPEELDHRVLGSPFKTIVAPGGSILFARIQQQIVGTCALIAECGHPDHYELAKMAVTAAHQGRGIGSQLLTAAIAKFIALGGTHLHLETSSRLNAAIRLYQSHGFRREQRPGGPSPYVRADVYMEYDPDGSRNASLRRGDAERKPTGSICLTKYQYHIVDVFSETPFDGNQLAVLPNAEGISSEGMQRIAREFNFAETTFVVSARDGGSTCRVRIFTPKAEVAFAGHPTIGTACALVLGNHHGNAQGCDLVFEEGIGPVRVRVQRDGQRVTAMLTLDGPLTRPTERPSLQALARTLSVNPEDVLDGFYASVGLPFCFAHLRSKESVDRATIDKQCWKEYFSNAWSSNIFFFAGELCDGGELYARMSAPALGVEEDPATGSACAALVGAVASDIRFESTTLTLKILQGVAMGRRSDITAIGRKASGRLASVSIGGATAYVSTGEISVPKACLTTADAATRR